MRPLGQKASFLALAAVVATAVMGAAHAMWFEDLSFNTTVTTGTLDARIGCVPGDSGGPAVEIDASNPPALVLTVSDAQPNTSFSCLLSIENSGTVAWHLESQEVSQTDSEPALVVMVANLEGCQVHGGEKLETLLTLAVPEDAQPESEYEVTLTFGVVQWNASAFGGCIQDEHALTKFAPAIEGMGRS